MRGCDETAKWSLEKPLIQDCSIVKWGLVLICPPAPVSTSPRSQPPWVQTSGISIKAIICQTHPKKHLRASSALSLQCQEPSAKHLPPGSWRDVPVLSPRGKSVYQGTDHKVSDSLKYGVRRIHCPPPRKSPLLCLTPLKPIWAKRDTKTCFTLLPQNEGKKIA